MDAADGLKKTKPASHAKHPCKGCFHWRGESIGSICCNYIFDVGHRRPCLPGKDCTCYKERGPLELELLRQIQKY